MTIGPGNSKNHRNLTLLFLLVFSVLFERYIAAGPIGYVASICFPICFSLIWLKYSDGQSNKVKLFFFAILIYSLVLIGIGKGGLFCLIILCLSLIVFFFPVLVLVMLCRSRKKDSTKGPTICIISLLLLPAAELENLVRPADPIVVQQSQAIVNYSAAEVFRSLKFYEELNHRVPMSLCFGFPRPVGSSGPLELGEEQFCYYVKGSLKKTIIEFKENRGIAFKVTSQNLHFERSLHLLGGGYKLEPLSANQTRVIVFTRYQAHLQPRFYWGPIERWFISEFHGYLLEGLELNVNKTSNTMASSRP